VTPQVASAAAPPPELVLEAGRADVCYWRDLWCDRELLGFFAWRDIQVRYKQTVLGASVTVAVFSLDTVVWHFRRTERSFADII
jgi:lipopolysaccharide transport system permease protein